MKTTTKFTPRDVSKIAKLANIPIADEENPELADWLIRKALEVKYKEKVKLKPLDDRLEQLAHRSVAKSLGV